MKTIQGIRKMHDVSRGLYCTLQRPNVDDLKTMVGWMKDPYLNESVFDGDTFEGGAKKQAKAWLQDNTSLYGSETLVLVCRALKSYESIGMVIFSNIDWRSRTAEIRYLIGGAKHRAGIYGPEMALLSLLFAFNTLNLHKLYGNVAATNKDSLNLAQFGGHTEGVLKGYLRDNEGHHDYLLLAIFANDFRAFIEQNRQRTLRRHVAAGLIE